MSTRQRDRPPTQACLAASAIISLAQADAVHQIRQSQLAEHLMGSITTIGAPRSAQMTARDRDAPLEHLASTGVAGYGQNGFVEGTRSDASQRILSRILGSRMGFRKGNRPRCRRLRAGGYPGFADPVETASDAGVLDRLIAFTGRQPAVVATSAN